MVPLVPAANGVVARQQTTTSPPTTSQSKSSSHSSSRATPQSTLVGTRHIATHIGTPATASAQSDSRRTGDHNSDNDIVNYYFVFLALGIAIIFAAAYMFHRRRRMNQRLNRLRRTDALARDVDSFAARSTAPSGYLGRVGRTLRPERHDSPVEEGLNERGEAPPPYQPNEGDEARTTDVTIPLQALTRGAKPPEYMDIARREDPEHGEDGIVRPASAAGLSTERR